MAAIKSTSCLNLASQSIKHCQSPRMYSVAICGGTRWSQGNSVLSGFAIEAEAASAPVAEEGGAEGVAESQGLQDRRLLLRLLRLRMLMLGAKPLQSRC